MKINRKEITLAVECPICHNFNEVMVNEEDYLAWVFDGMCAQDAFPYLSANEREILISGICPTCWEKNFGDKDEEEDWEEDIDECGYNPYMGCYDFDC